MSTCKNNDVEGRDDDDECPELDLALPVDQIWYHKQINSISENVLELLGSGPIVTHPGGEVMTTDCLTSPGTYFAVFFSALPPPGCPPQIQQFTQIFVNTYKTLQAAAKPFYVIFVSWDDDEQQFDEYFKEMPWGALPFRDSRIQRINIRYNVENIPTALIFNHEGTVINWKALPQILSDPLGIEFPWIPKPTPKVLPLNPTEDVINALNEKICVLLNVNGATDYDERAVLEEFIASANECPDRRVQYLVSDDKEFLEHVASHFGFTAIGATAAVVIFRRKDKDTLLSAEINRKNVTAFVETFCMDH